MRHTLTPLATVIVLVNAVLVLGLGGLWQNAAAGPSNDGIWRDVDPRTVAVRGQRQIVPRAYRTLAIDQTVLQSYLNAAPLERSGSGAAPTIMTLPLPDGSFSRFSIELSPIMESGLAAAYPDIRTFSGQGIDDPTSVVRFDLTPAGFHAMILMSAGTVYIDPYSSGDTTTVISYWKRDFEQNDTRLAELSLKRPASTAQPAAVPQAINGTTLRTYQLALAATGEYTQFHGGTVNSALAAMTTTINRVNTVYERDLAIRLVLINTTTNVIYTNPNTDPYSNFDGFAMLRENRDTLRVVIGEANYDIGHVFSTGGGGIAGLGVVCLADTGSGQHKAEGVTGSSAPVGDPFDVDYVAHEIGHQFGANHTFNTVSGSCGGGNRNSSTAYEPASGSTIMGYAGICPPEDLQPNSDDYFHTSSLNEIVTFISGAGNSCATLTTTGNAPPTVDAGLNYTIPSRTPFKLTGVATDLNNDALTYTWEQVNLGTASPPSTDNGNRPIFRSFTGTSDPTRIFPRLSNILNNTTSFGESLPTTNRTLAFRLTVRDNRAGGGAINDDTADVTVVASAGPFEVTAPNTAVTWAGNSTQEVTWSVAGTTNAPISCPNVSILLSADGGQTFPFTLLASTPNDGNQAITVPNISTQTARIQVICATNIFFDISNANLRIQAVAVTNTPTSTETSTPTNTPTSTVTNTPTNTPTDTPTDTPTIPMSSPTNTPTPTVGPNNSPRSVYLPLIKRLVQ